MVVRLDSLHICEALKFSSIIAIWDDVIRHPSLDNGNINHLQYSTLCEGKYKIQLQIVDWNCKPNDWIQLIGVFRP